MPVPTGHSHNSSDEDNSPPPASTVVPTTNLARSYSAPVNTSAPSSVVAPGPSSVAQTIIPQDPKDPLGLNNLPPAGSYLPGIGFVPQINQPPKMTARLQESAAPARPSVSAAPHIESEKVKMPVRHASVSSGKIHT